MANGFREFNAFNNQERGKEILNAFNWEFQLITPPAGVYYPGDEVFKSRLKTVGNLPTFSHAVAAVDGPSGFKSVQTGEVDHTNGAPTLTFVDYEDSSIFYMFRQWMDALQDPYTRTSTHKSLVTCNMNIIQLNTQLDPVITWMFRCGLPTDLSGYNTEFTDKKQPQGDISVSFDFEWWDCRFHVAGEQVDV